MMKLNIQMFADGKVVIDTKLDTKKFESGLKKIENTSQKAGSTVKNIVTGLGITKLISKGLNLVTGSVDKAVKRFDALNNFPKVMSNLGIGTKEAEAAMKVLSKGIQGLPTTLDDAAIAVQRFTSANGDVKKSTDIFLAVNDAIVAGGASVQTQASALEQLSQAYAKGKPDMMEWRSLQTAMPAQLKQVALAMGYAGGNVAELGEDLRNGNRSMDEFINTIVKLDKQGTNGFKSFAEQAQNAVGGIGTAMTNAKTAVARGVANIITSFNNVLRKNKFGSLAEVIAKGGKKMETGLTKLGQVIEKIPFDTLLKVLKKLVPVLATATASIIAYGLAVKGVAIANFVSGIAGSVTAFFKLIPAIKSAKDAITLLSMAFNVSPIGVTVAAIAALTVGLGLLYKKIKENNIPEVSEAMKKVNSSIEEYKNKMSELADARKKALSESAGELGHYQDLLTELKSITDANGRVKKGYEERAQIIATTLNDALGTEIKLNKGIIENYKGLEKEIQKVIEKKKAEAFLNANKAEYEEALIREKELWKNLTTATLEVEQAQKKFDNAIKDVAKSTGVAEENLMAYYKGIKTADEMMELYGKNTVKSIDKQMEKLSELGGATVPLIETLSEVEYQYGKNQKAINKYEEAFSQMQKGHYDAVQNILGNAQDFNNQMATISEQSYKNEVAKNNEKYRAQELAYSKYIESMKQQTGRYTQDEIKAIEDKRDRELAILAKQRDEANNTLKSQWENAKTITEQGVQSELDAINGKGEDFLISGKNNIKKHAEGIENGKPEAEKAAQNVKSASNKVLNDNKQELYAGINGGKNYAAGLNSQQGNAQSKAKAIGDTAVNELKKSEGKSNTSGKNFGSGFSIGIGSMLGAVAIAAARLGRQAKSSLDSSIDAHSPARESMQSGKWFDEGFAQGIKRNSDDVIYQVAELGENALDELNGIYDDMQHAIDLETSKMSADVQSSGTYQMAMAGLPTFNLLDNTQNQTQLVVNGKVLAEVVNTENRNREVASQ